MDVKKIVKESFVIIGKEGSTEQGEGFIGRLWAEANAFFSEIEPFVKKDGVGKPVGVWGAMSDFSGSFNPWEENFSKGLYLAGAECENDAVPPEGWTKWRVPSFEYICVVNTDKTAFSEGMTYLSVHNLTLAGAVQEFNCPQTGEEYLYFPVRRI